MFMPSLDAPHGVLLFHTCLTTPVHTCQQRRGEGLMPAARACLHLPVLLVLLVRQLGLLALLQMSLGRAVVRKLRRNQATLGAPC